MIKDFDAIMSIVIPILGIKKKLMERTVLNEANQYTAKLSQADCSAFHAKLSNINDFLSERRTKFLCGDDPRPEDCLIGMKILICLAISCVLLDDASTFEFNPLLECTHVILWLDRLQRLSFYDGIFSFPSTSIMLASEMSKFTNKFLGDVGNGVGSVTQAELDRIQHRSRTCSPLLVSVTRFFALGDSGGASNYDVNSTGADGMSSSRYSVLYEHGDDNDDDDGNYNGYKDNQRVAIGQLRSRKDELRSESFSVDDTDVSHCL